MTTLAHALRIRLMGGDVLLGTFLKLPSIDAVEVAWRAGCDFAVIDLEHAQIDEHMARLMVRHAHSLGFASIVRIPTSDSGQINRLLEAGAAGIQLSTVRSVQQAESLRVACLYPPRGGRSVSLSHPVAQFGATDLRAYLAEQQEGPLLVGQLETATTEDPILHISRHFDVVFIGTTDLSVDLGYPAQLEHPTVRARITEIAEAAVAANCVLGGWAVGPREAALLRQSGARYLVIASDVQLLQSSLRETISATRREDLAVAPPPPPTP